TVCQGHDGQALQPGTAYLAPGGLHMVVRGQRGHTMIATNDDPPEHSCRPAVDVLFRSVAETYGRHALAVVLTGMGSDGLDGCRHLVERGAMVLIQDRESSVIWGMPGAVAEAGLSKAEIPIDEMGRRITGYVARPA
ncbi:MAG: CheB methylesterase domain-containing protein, partial [Pirellulaceae bacterium]|nr:CheB methylesterase domain-containing protein [Pirellulaceae bacterium]